MPMASTSPNRVRLLRLKPKADITAKVPTRDTGMARIGMSAVRKFCRNTITTSTTRAIASKMVTITASTEACTNSVGL